MTNPIQTFSNHENSNNDAYIPVANYPVKYGESINVHENFIPEPSNIIINRSPTDYHRTQHVTRPQTASYQMQRNIYNRWPVIASTTTRSHFDSPIQEYLLHAQMPLPNTKTFIMINRDAEVEPDFLTWNYCAKLT